MNELSKSLGLGRFEKVSQHAEAVEKAASPTGGSASSTTPWHPNITSHISDDPGDPPFDRAPAASARAALHTFEAETGRKGSHASAAAAHAEAAGLHREAAAYYEKQDEPSWAKHHLKLADHHAYMAGDHENFCQGVTMSELGKSFGLGRFLQACNHKQLSETMYKAQASDQTEVVEKAKEGPRGTGPSDPDAVATVASMAMKPPTHYIHSHKAGESDQDTYYTYHQERAPNNLGQELGILNRHANHVIAHGTAPQLAHLWGHLEHRLGEFEGRRMATSGNEPPASAYDLPTKVGNALRAKLAKTPPRYLIGKSFDERLEEVVEKVVVIDRAPGGPAPGSPAHAFVQIRRHTDGASSHLGTKLGWEKELPKPAALKKAHAKLEAAVKIARPHLPTGHATELDRKLEASRKASSSPATGEGYRASCRAVSDLSYHLDHAVVASLTNNHWLDYHALNDHARSKGI